MHTSNSEQASDSDRKLETRNTDMRTILILSILTAVLLDGVQPKTDYAAERELVIESECTLDLAQVAFEIVRDGEPMEMPDRGEIRMSETRTVSVRETIEEVGKDGRPTQQLRAYESVELSSVQTMGDEDMEDEREGRLHEVTLALKVEEGETVCEVEEGEEPDEEEALEGHSLGLGLDRCLPDEEVEEGASWELDNDAVRAILGLDVETALFGGRIGRPEGEEGGRGGRGGRRGMRGRRSGGFSALVQAEWEGEATMESLEVDLDGVKCCLIALSFEASGEFEPPEREWEGGGRGRGGRALGRGLEVASTLVGVSYEAELEGMLWFAIEESRPVQLEVEGDISIITETIREMRDMSMEIYSEMEGEFELNVSVTEE